MYKIGEFSKIVNIPVRTLRYYDEFGILVPEESDKYTGYRYYSDHNIEECNTIMLLKSLDFSLEEIKKYKDNLSSEVFENKKLELQGKINLMQLQCIELDKLSTSLKTNSYTKVLK